MALEAGALDKDANFINPDCMAKYIEDALTLPPNADVGKRDRRLFLIAMSTGIIKYLKQHDHDSFVVKGIVKGPGVIGTLDIL